MDTSDNKMPTDNASKSEVSPIFNSAQSIVEVGINPAKVTKIGLSVMAATILLFAAMALLTSKTGSIFVFVGGIISMVELIVFAIATFSAKKCASYTYTMIYVAVSIILFFVAIPMLLSATARCDGMGCMGVAMIMMGSWVAGVVISVIMFVASLAAIESHRDKIMAANSEQVKTRDIDVASEEGQVANDNGISVLKREDLKKGDSYSGITAISVILTIASIGFALATPLRSGIRSGGSTITFICCVPVAGLLGILLLNICIVKTVQKRTNTAIILCYIPAVLSIIYNILKLDHVESISQIMRLGYESWGIPLISILLALFILVVYILTLGEKAKSCLPKGFSITLNIVAIVLYLMLAFLP
ncbi:hypothetical protein IKF25_01670 [Candidatus Saccharibacteria bacterium]|nr:hypothetical protein [Candidatus Saccharibacteria bacterium]